MKEEYIDVNRLKENLTTEIYFYSKGDIRKRLFARGLSLAYDIVNKQPTVDAVPVVRCKDCNWWNRKKETCIEIGGLWRASDFCSWGERREDETDRC